MSNKHLVYVYGSLKKGYWNNRLLENAKFVGEFRTKPNYKIFCNGSFPYMIEVEEGKGNSIFGEVYEVTSAELARCDRLEGHPHMYMRKTVALELAKGIKLLGNGVEAYIYQHEVSGCRPCNNCWPKDRNEESDGIAV